MRIKIVFLHSLILSFSYSLIAQSFPIGQISTTLTDASRSNRQIGVEVFYPATSAGSNAPVASGQFPVIAIGHGFSMTYDAYSNFWNEFVPQGYIIILPKTETGPIPFPSHGDFAQDLNYCISYLQTQNTTNASPFFGKISSKTAVMGHSMGGGCSFLAAGSNANITTLVGFAPAETNPSAIAAAANVTIPTLIFIGSKDNVAPGAGNATDMYNAVNASCKTYITVTDGSHCGFAESNFLCGFGETSVCLGCSFIPRAQQHATTFTFLNPWLRFYLKGECPQWNVFQNLVNTAAGVSVQQSCNYALPVAQFTASGNTSFCVGGSVDFTASGNYNYAWSTGEATQSITVAQSGDYSLIVTDVYDCRDTSGVTSVDVYTNPSPALRAKGDLQLCAGEVNELFLDNAFASYLWNNGSTDSTLVVVDSGVYFVQVIDASGCAGVSDTVVVEVIALPAEPVIEWRNDTLFVVSGNGNFQWYRNDTLLSGANNNFFVPESDGNYSLAIEDSNGCSSESEVISVTIISSIKSIESTVRIFPNPTNGKFVIEGNASHFLLFDKLGKEVMESTNGIFDISALLAGIYFLKAEYQKKVSYTRIVKY
ncbi:MAG: T9SS type A sorting domain-containing protein [Chitinophagales bacterium]|nr:T9SS type A sorting domain-containing protein [Chitinophagales bacterium]